jgi:hypothetical protein
MVKWKVSSARIQGSIHASEKTECQDFVFKSIRDDIVSVSLSDGAGRARFALKGALCCSMEAMRNLELRGASLFELEVEDISRIMLDNIRDKLKEKASESNCSLDELACTLCFFVTDGRHFIAGNLGDGLIGRMNPRGEGRVVLWPERGRYANQSFFVTGEDCYRHFHLIHGLYEPDCVYFMMTDGSCDCLFDRENESFAPALRTFCDWIRRFPHQAVSNSLKDAMYQLFPAKTGDDCALALVVVDKD